MTHDTREVEIARARIQELEQRVGKIVSDPQKSRRAKEMELAGVQGMILQIEQEIRVHQPLRVQLDPQDEGVQ